MSRAKLQPHPLTVLGQLRETAETLQRALPVENGSHDSAKRLVELCGVLERTLTAQMFERSIQSRRKDQ
jgi:hypothetical protein